MKTMKSIIVTMLLIAGTTLMAQTTRTNTYADRAFKQTSQLVSSLNLSDEQTVEILSINQKYTDMDAYNATNSKLTGREARKAKKNIITAQAKEIKSVLKGYQKEKFEYMVANHEVLAPQFNPTMAFNNAPQRMLIGAGAPNFQRSMR